MVSAPSVSSSITARLKVRARPTAVSELTTAIEIAGGIVTALDVQSSGREQMTVDVTCDTRGEDHAAAIVAAIEALPGVVVERVSDQARAQALSLAVGVDLGVQERDDAGGAAVGDESSAHAVDVELVTRGGRVVRDHDAHRLNGQRPVRRRAW